RRPRRRRQRRRSRRRRKPLPGSLLAPRRRRARASRPAARKRKRGERCSLASLAYSVAYTVRRTLCAGQVIGMAVDPDLFESMKLELRRGSLVMAVLACLRTERYGYTLRQALAADGLEMEESTLYPLLRRLEGQGLLDSA